MRRPGFLATALLFRRLTKELQQVNQSLRELAATQALALKLEAIKAGVTLTALKEAEEETSAEAEAGEAQVLMQSDGELALLEELEKAYQKAHGHPPEAGEDLLDILKKGGAAATALKHAGVELAIEGLERGEDRGR